MCQKDKNITLHFCFKVILVPISYKVTVIDNLECVVTPNILTFSHKHGTLIIALGLHWIYTPLQDIKITYGAL